MSCLNQQFTHPQLPPGKWAASRPNSLFNSDPNTSSWTFEWKGLGKVGGITVAFIQKIPTLPEP